MTIVFPYREFLEKAIILEEKYGHTNKNLHTWNEEIKVDMRRELVDQFFLIGYEAIWLIPQSPSGFPVFLFILMYPFSPHLGPHEFFTMM